MKNAVGWQQMGSDYAEARGIENAEGQCTRRHLSRPYKSRRHHNKPYAGGMLPAYFLIATMAATFSPSPPPQTVRRGHAPGYNTTIPT